MIRLGVWQLSRAEQKQVIVDQLIVKSNLPVLTANELFSVDEVNELRFRNVELNGRYDVEKTIYVDNQVVNGQVGYQVFTPFIVDDTRVVMIGRGFIGVGPSRSQLPLVKTQHGRVTLVGRLNKPPAKPPLWSDEYAVFEGSRWQFLPISDLAKQLDLDLFPLVLELAPAKAEANAIKGVLVRQWSEVEDHWVAKHKGYAFQWFAMAFAFLVACLILLTRTIHTKK